MIIREFGRPVSVAHFPMSGMGFADAVTPRGSRVAAGFLKSSVKAASAPPVR
jgi:hypothetical protein